MSITLLPFVKSDDPWFGDNEELPILVDHQMQLRKFMAERIPPESVLFSRRPQGPRANALSEINSTQYLESPYPELPPVKVGEYQAPNGMARYSRALYAVDWQTMRKIAERVWDWEAPLNDPEDENSGEAPITDVPENWGESMATSSRGLYLYIRDGENEFRANMRPLAPYRITGSGIDLWLLPLVDHRFFALDKVLIRGSLEQYPQLSQDAGSVTGIVLTKQHPSHDFVTSSHEDIFGFDFRFTDDALPDSLLLTLDAAILSIGYRWVYSPVLHTSHAQSYSEAETARESRLLVDSDRLTSGGMAGRFRIPETLNVYCLESGEIVKKTAAFTNPTVAPGISSAPIFDTLDVVSTWEHDPNDTAATDNFTSAVAGYIEGWANSGGQYCYLGVPSVQDTDADARYDLVLNGFDDYMSIDFFELEPEVYTLKTRIHELPPLFLPRVIVAGGINPTQERIIIAETPGSGITAGLGASCDLIDPTTNAKYSPNRTAQIHNFFSAKLAGSKKITAIASGIDSKPYIAVGGEFI